MSFVVNNVLGFESLTPSGSFGIMRTYIGSKLSESVRRWTELVGAGMTKFDDI